MKYIELTRGYRSIIDDDMYEYLNQWKWCYAHGYAMRRIYTGTGRKNNSGYGVYMHNLVVKPSEGNLIDHISRDTLDNRRSNIREVTKQENTWNRKLARDSRTGYKGVTFVSELNSWRVRITVDKKVMQLGYYKNIRDAAKAYNEAAKKYFGEYAWLNKI